MQGRSKVIFLNPISYRSKQIFKSKMESINKCHIDQESKTHLFLRSHNKKHFLMIQKQNDPNWEIVK